MQIYIIIPVYNRKAITLQCLENLRQHCDSQIYQTVVIDDGSTDGTSEAIRSGYPAVHLLQGDGQLWWTGAIVLGMRYAMEHGADYLIWLNDDTVPKPGTLDRLVQTCQNHPKTITSAQCYGDEAASIPTYGGQIRRGFTVKLIQTPPGQIQPCDCMSGNLVCFPRSVVETIGYPRSDRVPHCQADIVYTWQAKRSGYALWVVGDAIAVCAMNPLDTSWIESPTSMLKRLKMLPSPKSNLYPPGFWYYCWSFYGVLAPIPFFWEYLKLFLVTIARLLLPTQWIRSLKRWKDRFL